MKKSILVLVATVLASSSYLAVAAEQMKSEGMMMDMKKFDADADGMLSKEEFLKAHEDMFDRMKGPNGMVSIKDMPMHGGDGMMGKDNMMGKDAQKMGKDAQKPEQKSGY